MIKRQNSMRQEHSFLTQTILFLCYNEFFFLSLLTEKQKKDIFTYSSYFKKVISQRNVIGNIALIITL